MSCCVVWVLIAAYYCDKMLLDSSDLEDDLKEALCNCQKPYCCILIYANVRDTVTFKDDSTKGNKTFLHNLYKLCRPVIIETENQYDGNEKFLQNLYKLCRPVMIETENKYDE